jgi:hypothetical protein
MWTGRADHPSGAGTAKPCGREEIETDPTPPKFVTPSGLQAASYSHFFQRKNRYGLVAAQIISKIANG